MSYRGNFFDLEEYQPSTQDRTVGSNLSKPISRSPSSSGSSTNSDSFPYAFSQGTSRSTAAFSPVSSTPAALNVWVRTSPTDPFVAKTTTLEDGTIKTHRVYGEDAAARDKGLVSEFDWNSDNDSQQKRFKIFRKQRSKWQANAAASKDEKDTRNSFGTALEVTSQNARGTNTLTKSVREIPNRAGGLRQIIRSVTN
ncbi:hypothetical protein QFC19_009355 [Naganishia cerealis]|uniref:Uncharacterized protein n=1 Tax=Naganishia cerealis TaxID=610337 RepID=A0ACC2UW32_9TREE|nr:hypothetical protein QFC19_009355 [Naganishia cerealis]